MVARHIVISEWCSKEVRGSHETGIWKLICSGKVDFGKHI